MRRTIPMSLNVPTTRCQIVKISGQKKSPFAADVLFQNTYPPEARKRGRNKRPEDDRHGGDAYYSFISDLRSELGDQRVTRDFKARLLPEAPPVTPAFKARDLPEAPPNKKTEKTHITVKIVSSRGNEAIMLVIRRSDCYLIGYRLEGRPHYHRRPPSEDLEASEYLEVLEDLEARDNGCWYIFERETVTEKAVKKKAVKKEAVEKEAVPECIGKNYEEMSFKGTYAELATAAGRSQHSLDTQLGRNALDSALYDLAHSDNSTNQSDVASALLVIIQMVCEASRLSSIGKMIAARYDEPSGVRTDAEMVERYRDWLKSCTEIVSNIPAVGETVPEDLKAKLEEVRLVKLKSNT
ncbi:hypothetical protein G7054_g8912 [Neopestalotiopsis clavispora]|nr:hypothetical protein G7054_g8912 [Neopestalotiopsis clavispora]